MRNQISSEQSLKETKVSELQLDGRKFQEGDALLRVSGHDEVEGEFQTDERRHAVDREGLDLG